jgi:hypothetical protein
MSQEIFDEYVKIAEKMGLINPNSYITAEEEAKKKKDSAKKDMDLAAALFYGIKPNGKEDDISLLEKAHPGVAVVSPAEDRMNGIVENDQQRQNIMMQIAMRPTNGKYQQKAFVTAHENLAKSLTKASIALQREQYQDLSKFAIDCNERLEKEALGPLVVPGLIIGGVVLAVGAIAAINYTSNTAVNVATNAAQTQKELEDLRGKLSNDRLDSIIDDLDVLREQAAKFSNLPTIKAISKEDIPIIKEKFAKELKMAATYRNVLEQFSKNIPLYISQLKNTETKTQDDDSWDWWEKVRQVVRLVTPDDIGDAVNAFEGLEKAITKAIANVDFYVKDAEKYTPTIKAVLAQSENPVSGLAAKETSDDKTSDDEVDTGSLGDLKP